MRILAVDFGERRIGLATSDAEGRLATPRETVLRREDGRAVDAIVSFCAREEIEEILFGIPRSPEGAERVESTFAARIRSFARKVAAKTTLPIRFHEETLTSNEAARRLPPGSGREALDAAAAAVLLEDYLSHARRLSEADR